MYGTEAGVDLFFDTNLPALLCKSSYSSANQYFSVTISITQQRRFVSKRGHRQPHIQSKARVLSAQLQNGLFLKFLHFYHVQRYPCVSTSPARTFERKASCLALLCGKIKHKQA